MPLAYSNNSYRRDASIFHHVIDEVDHGLHPTLRQHIDSELRIMVKAVYALNKEEQNTRDAKEFNDTR